MNFSAQFSGTITPAEAVYLHLFIKAETIDVSKGSSRSANIENTHRSERGRVHGYAIKEYLVLLRNPENVVEEAISQHQGPVEEYYFRTKELWQE